MATIAKQLGRMGSWGHKKLNGIRVDADAYDFGQTHIPYLRNGGMAQGTLCG